MIPQIRTLSGLDNDADGISLSQSPAGAGNLTITGALASGGSVTLTVAQRVSISSAADDTGRTFTVTGKDADGKSITDAITGANAGAAAGVKYFKVITQIAVDAATAGAVTAGVFSANGGVSGTIVANYRATDFSIGMGVNITGTLSATVQQCFDNIMDASITPVWTDTLGLTALTATDKGNIAFPVRGIRLKLNSWTSGSATLNYVQAG